MIALGGWNDESEKYSHMAKSPQLRAHLIGSVVQFIDKNGFDGIDVDWEYPGARGGDINEDEIHFIELITELKAASDPHGYVLSAAISRAMDIIDNGYDVKAMDKILDFYSIMIYNYHGGSREKHIGHNAPLYVKPGDDKFNFTKDFNVNFTINYWLS
jgi:chitinase